MKGMTFRDFMDKIYYGDEIEFNMKGITYFVQGYKAQGSFFLTVDYWSSTDGRESDHDYLFSIKCNSADERKRQFENARIFDGKTIYEAESCIEVMYG